MLRKMFFFTTFYLLSLMATAIAGKLMGGQPFNSISGWRGVLALLGLLVVVGGIAACIWLLGRARPDNDALAVITVAGTVAVLLLAVVGIAWLIEPLRTLAGGGGVWWPLVTLLGCGASWLLLKPSR